MRNDRKEIQGDDSKTEHVVFVVVFVVVVVGGGGGGGVGIVAFI